MQRHRRLKRDLQRVARTCRDPPRRAAEIYGLDILAGTSDGLTTPRDLSCARGEWAPQGAAPLVTTFVFNVRNVPAALYKAMGGLRQR